MPAGIHLAVVTDIKRARDSFGNILVKPDTGEIAVEITFKNGKAQKVSTTIWMTEKSVWVFKRLCDAVEVSYTDKDGVSVKEVIGKRLWIVVGMEFVIENEQLAVDSHGKLIVYTKLLNHFMRVVDPSLAPALQGDPTKNGGVPSGSFIVNKKETLPGAFEEQFVEAMKEVNKDDGVTVISDTDLPDKPF